ncbi:MAG: Uma2 family endonuclease [Gemmataceae bacterium]|nr:Uma2 family endonuclease [Gemmataceae bacterium]
MTPTTAATIDDLYRVDGKAELIGGRIVPIMPSGYRHGLVGGHIYEAIAAYARANRRGVALPDGIGFVVPELSSGRESFSPDVAYYTGPVPADVEDFLPGPPALAVEVRSKGDYGPAAEAEMAQKRADYFEAGTAVVWDADPRAEAIRVYTASAPDRPTEYGRGQSAEAEPVMPGWRLSVDAVLA